MKVYLDLCVYNRPFDYQGQTRIALESSAFIYVLEEIEGGSYELVVSEALMYENSKNPDEERRLRIASYFNLAKEFIKVDSSDVQRAEFLKTIGFKDLDALHIALAEKSKVDYFVTCDDGIVSLYKKNRNNFYVKIVGLIEFISLEVGL